MRISSTLALLLLASACHPAQTDQANLSNTEAAQGAKADDEGLVECARGTAAFVRECTVDRQATDRGLMLTVRRPDGSFRRLLVTKDGRGVIAADGAQAAKVSVVGADRIEVTLGGDRYRLPATVRGGTTPR